jgi:hypothetical protein
MRGGDKGDVRNVAPGPQCSFADLLLGAYQYGRDQATRCRVERATDRQLIDRVNDCYRNRPAAPGTLDQLLEAGASLVQLDARRA